jgi:hypothetical protein
MYPVKFDEMPFTVVAFWTFYLNWARIGVSTFQIAETTAS